LACRLSLPWGSVGFAAETINATSFSGVKTKGIKKIASNYLSSGHPGENP
jgi:hypothetical protein